jgi:alpha-L-fucosidase
LRGNTLELNLPQAVTFNLIELQEDISLGQRVFSFQVETEKNGNWTVLTEGTTIGYKRILPVPGCTSSHLRIRVTGTYAPPMLLNAALYLRPVLHNNL